MENNYIHLELSATPVEYKFWFEKRCPNQLSIMKVIHQKY